MTGALIHNISIILQVKKSQLDTYVSVAKSNEVSKKLNLSPVTDGD